LNSFKLFLFPKKWLKSAHISAIFSYVAMLCLLKIALSEQILAHFRLKTKSQDEFIIFTASKNIKDILDFVIYL